MKYSREDIELLMYKDYILLMAEELNNNGFTDNGKRYEVGTNVNGNFVSDFSRGFILALKDQKATDFLKEIGLLNNGRCPLTGLMISSASKTTFTSEYNSSITYDISSTWLEYTKTKRNWGCCISPAIIVAGIVLGIVNSFNVYTYSTIGLGILIAVLSGMYGGTKLGDNWNKLCLSNELGINTATLFSILKMEESGEGMNYLNASKHDIPFSDFNAYMQWRERVL